MGTGTRLGYGYLAGYVLWTVAILFFLLALREALNPPSVEPKPAHFIEAALQEARSSKPLQAYLIGFRLFAIFYLMILWIQSSKVCKILSEQLSAWSENRKIFKLGVIPFHVAYLQYQINRLPFKTLFEHIPTTPARLRAEKDATAKRFIIILLLFGLGIGFILRFPFYLFFSSMRPSVLSHLIGPLIVFVCALYFRKNSLAQKLRHDWHKLSPLVAIMVLFSFMVIPNNPVLFCLMIILVLVTYLLARRPYLKIIDQAYSPRS